MCGVPAAVAKRAERLWPGRAVRGGARDDARVRMASCARGHAVIAERERESKKNGKYGKWINLRITPCEFMGHLLTQEEFMINRFSKCNPCVGQSQGSTVFFFSPMRRHLNLFQLQGSTCYQTEAEKNTDR